MECYTSLEVLELGDNKIGIEGCEGIAKLLANESSSLRVRVVSMANNNISDKGAEISANSLTHNTFETLYLWGNDIAERGSGAFLKLLNDVSLIERGHTSPIILSDLSGLRKR